MTGWTAIVPIKSASLRKSRLADRFSADARIALTEAMLSHVLATLNVASSVNEVAILSAEKPRDWRGRWFPDTGTGLNEELGAVARLLQRRMLIVHADLPALTDADVGALIAEAADGSAIAPDRHLKGTNALALDRADDLIFCFGPASFAGHRQSLPDARIVRRIGLALDVDDEDDWAEAVRLGALPGGAIPERPVAGRNRADRCA